MNTKHTPGKWTAGTMGDKTVNGLQIFKGKRHLATTHYGKDAGYTEAQANAKLIAAAPLMLEALQDLVDYLGEDWQSNQFVIKAHEAIQEATK